MPRLRRKVPLRSEAGAPVLGRVPAEFLDTEAECWASFDATTEWLLVRGLDVPVASRWYLGAGRLSRHAAALDAWRRADGVPFEELRAAGVSCGGAAVWTERLVFAQSVG